MYKTNIAHYQDELLKTFVGDSEKQKVLDLFQNLVFKLEKNLYHLNNINLFIEKASGKNDFLTLMPIYFELESFLVSTRSSVDMLMHILNYCLHYEIESTQVSVSSVYRCKKLSKPLKEIFARYTTPYNNPTWSFIYLFRNEVVHEKSIFQVMPLQFKPVLDHTFLYAKIGKTDKEITDHLKVCLRFLDKFIERVLSILEISIKK
ncbi:hypothetical protein [Bacillus toyonensis]|uniref:hypothetical protein n=1 Tax=Bacillus toyonensis TaxID=155322 RepID=UPI002E1A0DE0|nr:hypothetical protein [Bacillus toyonensis]